MPVRRLWVLPLRYTSYIGALGRSGQWERALDVYDDMAAAGVAGNVVTFSSLISACEKGGQWQEAVKVYHKVCPQISPPFLQTIWHQISRPSRYSSCSFDRKRLLYEGAPGLV